MTREAQLSDLLMRWEELRQQGKNVAAEDLCYPYLAQNDLSSDFWTIRMVK